MKKILLFLTGVVVSILKCSCFGETCTSTYIGSLKIDGKKGDEVSIRYIGAKERNYEQEFGSLFLGKAPYYRFFILNTICDTKDFRNHNFDFLEIKNLGTEVLYVCAVIDGREVDRIPNYNSYTKLLELYDRQDKDPFYDYTKDKSFEGVKIDYVDRYEFYEQLLKENYPYIIKLEPQKTCIMKWNNLGFKVL